MNKKIKELYDRAGVTLSPYNMDVNYKEIEFLVEMAIKECIKLLPEECQSENGCHAAWTIKEHFGIK